MFVEEYAFRCKRPKFVENLLRYLQIIIHRAGIVVDAQGLGIREILVSFNDGRRHISCVARSVPCGIALKKLPLHH